MDSNSSWGSINPSANSEIWGSGGGGSGPVAAGVPTAGSTGSAWNNSTPAGAKTPNMSMLGVGPMWGKPGNQNSSVGMPAGGQPDEQWMSSSSSEANVPGSWDATPSVDKKDSLSSAAGGGRGSAGWGSLNPSPAPNSGTEAWGSTRDDRGSSAGSGAWDQQTSSGSGGSTVRSDWRQGGANEPRPRQGGWSGSSGGVDGKDMSNGYREQEVSGSTATSSSWGDESNDHSRSSGKYRTFRTI